MAKGGLGIEPFVVILEAKVCVGEAGPASVTGAIVSTLGSQVPLIAVYTETSSVVEVNPGCGPFGVGVGGTPAALLAFPEALNVIDGMLLAVGEPVPDRARSVRVCSKVPDGEGMWSDSFEPADGGDAVGGSRFSDG